MYESCDTLRIKEKAGIVSAALELQYRKAHKTVIPLRGLQGVSVFMIVTKEIEEKIEAICNLYEKVNNTQKVKDIILLDAYHSATIEGARTTVESVKRTYNKPVTKDDKMVVNTIHGMNYAYGNEICMDNIRTLWEIVTRDVCENIHLAGTKFRSGMVYVGNETDIIHTPAKAEEIGVMMQDLFLFLENSEFDVWIRAAILHFYFVYIHPFCDGNGRTARIMTQSFLLHHGIEKIKYLPLSRAINNSLSGYYAALKESERVYTNGSKWIDITPFIDYMLDTIGTCMVTAVREDNELSENRKALLEKIQKRGKGTEISIATAAKILKMSEQTAGKHLNALVRMGYLKKERRGHKNIYILK